MFLACYRRLLQFAAPRFDKTTGERRARMRRRLNARLILEALETRLAPAMAQISLPTSGFTGTVGTMVMNYPVSIASLSDGTHVGLSSVLLDITFPTGVFSFSVGGNLATYDVSLGSIPAANGGSSHWNLAANSPADGVLAISLTAQQGDAIYSTTGGSLVNINFPVSSTFNSASSTPETIQVVLSATGVSPTQLNDSNGTYNAAALGLPASGTITINHTTQTPPTIATPQTYRSEANTTLNVPAPGLLGGANDPEGQTMTVNTINGAPYTTGSALKLPSGATLTVQSNGSFTYIPVNNFVGTDSITFTVSDTGGRTSSTGTVTLGVTPTLSIVPQGISSGAAGTVIWEGVYLDNPNPVGGMGPLTGFNLAITYQNNQVLASNIITGVTIDKGGMYTSPPMVTFSGGNGTGAAGQVSLFNNGSDPGGDPVAGVGMIDVGTGYLSPPTVTFTGGTGTAAATGHVDPNPSSSEFSPDAIFGSNIPGTWTGDFNDGTTSSPAANAQGVIALIGFGSGQGADLVVGPAPLLMASFAVVIVGTAATTTPIQLVTTAQLSSGSASTIIIGNGNFPVNPSIGPQGSAFVSGVDTMITISPLTFSPSTLHGETENVPYSQTIAASGGNGPYKFATAGTLPSGLTLSSNGVLMGTPTVTGTYSFPVTVTDSQGAVASQSYTLTINPPVRITTTVLSNCTAGTAHNQTISSSGGTAPITFSANSSLPVGLTLSSAGVLSGTPTTAGVYNFTVTATDSVAASASQSFTVVTIPGPLTQFLLSTLVGAPTATAGSPFLVTVQGVDKYSNPVVSYSGPSTVTAQISPTSNSSSFPATIPIGSNGQGEVLAVLQTVGMYTITASGGAFTSNAVTVTVTAAAAAKLAFAVQPVATPTGVTLPAVTVQVLDAYGNVVTIDNSDSITLTVASGPGTFAAGSTTTTKVVNGVANFSNLELITPGNYTLGAVVAGLYTGAPSAAFTVLPLQVVASSFMGTATGFSLQFNAPFLVNSTTPVLYGSGFGPTAPPPSVIVTTDPGNLHDSAAIVTGSLVLNTATNSITFVATNSTLVVNDKTPVLPDGTYTVIVRSSAATDGFQALIPGGGFLDGKGTGAPGSGDYVATFTVNASAAHDAILWIPPTADGPGQVLNAPGKNQVGGGYPLYLDSTGGVTKVQVTLNYNPGLLTVTGVTGANFSLLGTSTAGHAVLQYSGPVVASGTQTAVGFITATVPSGNTANPEPYKAKDLLHLSSVALNGMSTAVVGSDALHLVAYVGDGDGNGAYSSIDAVLITRVLVSTDDGFTAYPLVDPTIVADTDGSGFIPSDAALQANEAGVGFPTANLAIPPIPSGVVFQAIANNVDPTVSLPAGLYVGGAGTVTVPVNIDDAHPAGSTGLIRATLALRYDPRAFTVSAADIHLGSVPLAGTGWTLASTINSVTGEIAIELSSTTPISSALGGSLVTIDLHAIAGYSGPAAIQLVASVNPTGQQVVATQLQDAQGTFTLTPAASNGFDPLDPNLLMQAWHGWSCADLKSELDRQEFGFHDRSEIGWR